MFAYMCRCISHVYVYIYIYIYESERGASKDREPAGGEEKTERESRLIRETRMSRVITVNQDVKPITN